MSTSFVFQGVMSLFIWGRTIRLWRGSADFPMNDILAPSNHVKDWLSFEVS